MQTIWCPDLSQQSGPLYRAIANSLADDIRQQRLAAGARLPTMRALAESLSVTVGTVYRAYALAEKQGLIVRHMGRGTFVRSGTGATLGAEVDGTVDLTRNEPVEIPLDSTLRRTLTEMARECDLEGMLDYGYSQGLPRHREALAAWISERGYAADPDSLIVTSGAQQALTIALGALTQAGQGLMVEALTYPGIKNLARLFGLRLCPVVIDEDGLDPDDLAKVAERTGARVLYAMPNVHNPTTATLTLERRQALGRVAEKYGIVIIEDDLYPRGPAALPCLAEVAPQQTVYISSLSKTVAPGLRVGSIIAPARLLSELVAVTQTTSWMAPPLMTELASRWIEDGTVAALAAERDRVTRHLQGLAEKPLAGLRYRVEPHNAHIWLPLGSTWRGEEFAAKAAERRILVSPAEDFAIDPQQAPAAVRICLAAYEAPVLCRALEELATLALGQPGPTEFRM